MKHSKVLMAVTTTLVMIAVFSPPPAVAHCDSLSGPVVTAAKSALDKGDVTPVLKWIRQEDEAEIRAAFSRAATVRKQGPEARELADHYFFETLVRVHRAGEGAPFTGLKPADAVDDGIAAADRALESGSPEQLLRALTSDVQEGVRKRLAAAQQAKAHAEHNVEAGRAYVRAYVEFIHYVERLHADAVGLPGEHVLAPTHQH